MNTLNELISYCSIEKPAGALLLTGEWGCGKTYMIEHDLKDALKDKCLIIRVSLFTVKIADDLHKAVKSAWLEKDTGFSTSTTEKIKKVVDSVLAIVEKIPAAKQYADSIGSFLNINLADYITITPKIEDKKVILVFDDLERCSMPTRDILGVINDYCENQGFNVIIVANEEKIGERSKKNELSYAEIKEKVVQRTVHLQRDYGKVIDRIINDLAPQNPDYKSFLEDHKEALITLFTGSKPSYSTDNGFVAALMSGFSAMVKEAVKHPNENNKKDIRQPPHNIRALKAAIQDFERIYGYLDSGGIENKEKWLFSFVSSYLSVKAGLIDESPTTDPDTELDVLVTWGFDKTSIECYYPGFYDEFCLCNAIKEWILNGFLDEEKLVFEIEKIRVKNWLPKPEESFLQDAFTLLDEEEIAAGLGKVLDRAYKGDLSLPEYIKLIENSRWARSLRYKLPEEIDWEKICLGIEIRLQIVLQEGGIPDKEDVTLSETGYLLPEEQKAYNLIVDAFEGNKLSLAHYRNDYIKHVGDDHTEVFECDCFSFYGYFSKEMADATFNAFEKASNFRKHFFVESFYNSWTPVPEKANIEGTNIEDTIEALSYLDEKLLDLFIRCKEKPIVALHTSKFESYISTLINKYSILPEEVGKLNKASQNTIDNTEETPGT